jgi:ankyrin repeat protein
MLALPDRSPRFDSPLGRTPSGRIPGSPPSLNSSMRSGSPRGSPRVAGLIGLRSIPGRIRALAKAIHDDTQFDELRHHNTGAFRMPVAVRVLEDMGVHLTDEELMLFDCAVAEYAQQLQGVDRSLVKREAVGKVLTATAAIDSEAAFAGVSVPTTMGAVVRAHAVFLTYINTVLPASGVEPFTAFSNAVTELLEPLQAATKAIAARRGRKFRPSELPVVQRANGRLWRLVNEVERLVPAMLQTCLFDAHSVIDDAGAREAWDHVAGRRTAVITSERAAALIEHVPEGVRGSMLRLLSLEDTGFVTAHAFGDLVRVWGPYVILAENFYRDVIMGYFCFNVSPDEAELHLTAEALLFTSFEAGDRRHLRTEAASVKGSSAQAMALSSADEAFRRRPGNFCIAFAHEPGDLTVFVLNDQLKVMAFPLSRQDGAWMIAGLSKGHFESIYDAVEAHRSVLRNAVGHDEELVWDGEPLTQDLSCHLLHRACFCNNLKYVAHLLSMGSDVVINVAMEDAQLVPNRYSWPPLLFAVNSPTGDPHQLVSLLIERGAAVNVFDAAGCSPLYYAVANGYTETVRVLLAAQPDLVSSKSTDRVLTALGAHHFISEESDVFRLSQAPLVPEIVQMLIHYENDADFVLLCSAIIDGKLLGVDVLPDPALTQHTSDNPRLVHLKSRAIITQDQQRSIDDMITNHSATARVDGSARRTQTVLQHRLFALSTTAHFQALREDLVAMHADQPRLLLAPFDGRSHSIATTSDCSAVGASHAHGGGSRELTPLHQSTAASPTSVEHRTPFASPHAAPSSRHSIDTTGWPSARWPRRRSTLALSLLEDGDGAAVLLSARELVEARRKYSIATNGSDKSPTGQRRHSTSTFARPPIFVEESA